MQLASTYTMWQGCWCAARQVIRSGEAIAMSGLPAGVYIVRVEVGDEVVSKRVVKY